MHVSHELLYHLVVTLFSMDIHYHASTCNYLTNMKYWTQEQMRQT